MTAADRLRLRELEIRDLEAERDRAWAAAEQLADTLRLFAAYGLHAGPPYSTARETLAGFDAAKKDAANEDAEARCEMRCDRCRRYHGVVWFAPSDIWNAVMRGGDRGAPDEFPFCCPICFITLAEEHLGRTMGWLVLPFADGPVDRAEQVVFKQTNPDTGE